MSIGETQPRESRIARKKLQEQIDEFLATGGKIEKVPFGIMTKEGKHETVIYSPEKGENDGDIRK